MAADRVDQHGPLTHLELAAAVQHQDALTLGAVHGHKAHAGPADSLADRHRIRRVALPWRFISFFMNLSAADSSRALVAVDASISRSWSTPATGNAARR